MSILIGLAALEVAYLLATGPWRRRFGGAAGPPPPLGRGRQATFMLGILVIGIALASPLDDLAEYLQSMHMIQHLLLVMIGAPLLLLGLPGWLLRPALGWRGFGGLARRLTRPGLAFAVSNVIFIGWHIPALYDASLRVLPVHILQHLTFLLAGVLIWWPLLSPLPELPRLSAPLQMLYVFAQTLPGALLGIILGYAPVPLYAAYVEAPRLFGLSALQDQQIAGLIMWVGTNLFWLAVLTVVFFTWAAREEDDLAGERARKRVKVAGD